MSHRMSHGQSRPTPHQDEEDDTDSEEFDEFDDVSDDGVHAADEYLEPDEKQKRPATTNKPAMPNPDRGQKPGRRRDPPKPPTESQGHGAGKQRLPSPPTYSEPIAHEAQKKTQRTPQPPVTQPVKHNKAAPKQAKKKTGIFGPLTKKTTSETQLQEEYEIPDSSTQQDIYCTPQDDTETGPAEVYEEIEDNEPVAHAGLRGHRGLSSGPEETGPTEEYEEIPNDAHTGSGAYRGSSTGPNDEYYTEAQDAPPGGGIPAAPAPPLPLETTAVEKITSRTTRSPPTNQHPPKGGRPIIDINTQKLKNMKTGLRPVIQETTFKRPPRSVSETSDDSSGVDHSSPESVQARKAMFEKAGSSSNGVDSGYPSPIGSNRSSIASTSSESGSGVFKPDIPKKRPSLTARSDKAHKADIPPPLPSLDSLPTRKNSITNSPCGSGSGIFSPKGTNSPHHSGSGTFSPKSTNSPHHSDSGSGSFNFSPRGPGKDTDVLKDQLETDLCQFRWFSSNMGRQEAETALRSKAKDGTFVVRNPSHAIPTEPYVLSIWHQGHFRHLKICLRDTGQYAVGTAKPNEKTFTTVPELINYHLKHAMTVGGSSNPEFITLYHEYIYN